MGLPVKAGSLFLVDPEDTASVTADTNWFTGVEEGTIEGVARGTASGGGKKPSPE